MQLPALPLNEWDKTKMTLHLYIQIVGKIRLKSMPRKNHWWNITLHVTPKGITTGLMPYEKGCFEIQFNFIRHRLEITTSNDETEIFSLYEGLSVAGFYKNLVDTMNKIGIQIQILSKPIVCPIQIPSQHRLLK